MDLFDKLVLLLGGEVISLEEFARILDTGYEEARVGILPPGYDRVVFGDMERTRLDSIRVLFVAGVNDGVIPKAGRRRHPLRSGTGNFGANADRAFAYGPAKDVYPEILLVFKPDKA